MSDVASVCMCVDGRANQPSEFYISYFSNTEMKPLLLLRLLLGLLDASSWSGPTYDHIVSCVEFNLILASISGEHLSVPLKQLRFALLNAEADVHAPVWISEVAMHVAREAALQRRRAWVRRICRC